MMNNLLEKNLEIHIIIFIGTYFVCNCEYCREDRTDTIDTKADWLLHFFTRQTRSQ